MKNKRKFIIKIENKYVKKFVKNSIGYYYTSTHIIENAKVWKHKKTCENCINKVLDKKDPTKNIIYLNNFEIIEITDNQTLRNIKLNKINKK